MKKSFNFTALKSPLFLIGVVSVALNAALWALVLTLFPREIPAAILHYNVAVGIDFVGEGRQILVLPSIGAALLILNILLAYLLREIRHLAGLLLMSTSVLAQLLLLAAFVAILGINT